MCNKMDVLFHQMERSVRHFDMEHQLLRHENLRLCMQLNMADLQQLMLYQELLLLEESKWRRDSLQEKLNGCIKEENSIMVGDSLLIHGSVTVHLDDLLMFLPSGSP